MKTVIEMAREIADPEKADPWDAQSSMCVLTKEELERLVALIRADERNSWPAEMEAMERQVNILTDALAEERDRMKWDVHSCGPTCKRYACVALREAVEAEREACAKVCDDLPLPPDVARSDASIWEVATLDCAEAIRARSNT